MSKRKLAAVALAVGIAMAVAAAAGCGSSGKTGTKPQTSPPAQTSPPESQAKQVKLFFYNGQALVEVTRTAPKAGAQQALIDMLQGPTREEAQGGLVTAIPQGTTLNSYAASGGTARADFSKEMGQFGGGSARAEAITRQVERTIKANDPSITSVKITVMGVPAEEAVQP